MTERAARMALHDITTKLRAYTRHPTMGGNTSVPQVLIDEAADEIEWLRNHIRCLIENDPNDDAADAVTVLDVWRKEALERFGEWPKPGVPDNPF